MTPIPAPPHSLGTEMGGYYVRRGTLDELEYAIGDLKDFSVEEIWMRPVPPPPMEERWDPEPIGQRGPDGRFERVWWWEECSESADDAVPYYRAEWKSREERQAVGKEADH